MADGGWDRASFMGRELKGKTLGIVGLGRIGGEVATRAHAFGMHGRGLRSVHRRRAIHRAARAPRASLDALLAETNILTVHVPLTDETQGMIGKRELGRLPSRSVVVNMARGGIIDEAALLAALEADQLRGAVLDVFDARAAAGRLPAAPCAEPGAHAAPRREHRRSAAQCVARCLSRRARCAAAQRPLAVHQRGRRQRRLGRTADRDARRATRRRGGARGAGRSGHARGATRGAARRTRSRARRRGAAGRRRRRRARRRHRNRSPQPHQRPQPRRSARPRALGRRIERAGASARRRSLPRRRHAATRGDRCRPRRQHAAPDAHRLLPRRRESAGRRCSFSPTRTCPASSAASARCSASAR